MDIRDWLMKELDTSKSIDTVIYKNAAGVEFTAQALASDPKNKTIYLPSGVPITATTQIENSQNQEMNVELRLENPEDAKYFKGGTVPAITQNETSNQLTKAGFAFELVADLDDELTAEGKTIKAQLIFRRAEVNEGAADFKRLPVVIACNSPPPAIKDVQLVKSKTTKQVEVLFNLDADEAELKLKHRDLAFVKALACERVAMSGDSDDISVSYADSNRGSAVASINYDKVSGKYDFPVAVGAGTYEVFSSGIAPTNVTENQTISLTTDRRFGELDYKVFLQDSVGLTTPEIITGTLKKLSEPIIQDMNGPEIVLGNTNAIESPNLLGYSKEDGSAGVKLSPKKEAADGSPVTPTVTLKYAFWTQDDTSAESTINETTATKELSVEDFTTYNVKFWQEAPGYAASETEQYRLEFDPPFRVVSENGDDANTGSKVNPYNTFDKALAVVKGKGSSVKEYTIFVSGNIELSSALELKFMDNGWVPNDPLTLTISGIGNDATITGAADKEALHIKSGQKYHKLCLNNLTIEAKNGTGITVQPTAKEFPLVLDGCTIEGNNSGTVGINIYSGIVTMHNTTIQNFYYMDDSPKWGAGVTMQGGALRMTGASKITGNKTACDAGGGLHIYNASSIIVALSDSAAIEGNESAGNGGGVSVAGGSRLLLGYVYDDTKAAYVPVDGFTGGVNNNTAVKGGGIYLTGDGTQCQLNGGFINGNTASGSGGGVYIDGKAIFTMKAGSTIASNTADDTMGGGGGGGGVVLNGDTAKFIMDGGCIGNAESEAVATADSCSNKALMGGGVYVMAGTFTHKAGTISYNYANTAGGGVCVAGTYTQESGAKVSYNFSNMGGGVAIVHNEGFTDTATLSGTIQKNKAKNGGGVNAETKSLTIENCTINENEATEQGGGLYLQDGDATYTITEGTTISNNYAENQGGGIYLNSGRLNMSGGQISGNRCPNGQGGGVYLSSGAMPFTMTGGIIGQRLETAPTSRDEWSNYADNGGGVYVAGSFEMSGGQITGNACGGNGGGVYQSGGQTEVTLSGDATVSYNSSGQNGGGVYLDSLNSGEGTTFTMGDNATIIGNTLLPPVESTSGGVVAVPARSGAGIYGSGDKNCLTFQGGSIKQNSGSTDNSNQYYIEVDGTEYKGNDDVANVSTITFN